jgi:capsular exopolysaccharide synthesis family protein
MEGFTLRPERRGGSPDSSTARTSAASTPGVGEYFRAIYRHRWLALLTMVLVSVPVALYGVLQPKAYEARIRLVLNAEQAAPVSFEESRERPASDERTQQEIIRSREVARRAIVALRLWRHPVFAGTAIPTIGRKAPVSKDEERWVEPLVPVIIDRTKVIPLPLSRLVDVVFEAPDAQLSADVVNELGRQFIQENLDARVATARQSTAWLEERLKEQRLKVEESEAALQKYKEQQDALSVDARQNIVVQRLSDLNTSVTKAKTDRMVREATYAQIKAAESNPALLESIPAVASNAEVRALQAQVGDLRRQEVELSQRYGDKHPTRVKVAAALETTEGDLHAAMARTAEVVKNEYEGALAQERSMSRALEAQKGEALRLNQQDLEYGRLQREAEANRQIFNALSQQAQQSTISGEFKESSIRILDFAQPPHYPIRPQRTKFVGLAIAMGLFAAILVALAREMLDTRVKTPNEITEHLRLPFLGLVPALRTGRKAVEAPIFSAASSPFSDALRRIRATLLGALQERPVTLLVTSTGPREGKTTIAVSLAQSFAAGAHRVLIIDTDLRRPAVHARLEKESRRGLAEYLAGTATLDEILIETGTAHLSAILAGKVPPNPAELLESPKFADLVESMKARFDWIVIDSAPVLSVPEASQVARSATAIVFVVGAQMASRHAALRATQELANANVPFAGCILNRAEVSRHAYYYGAYNNEKYENYYRVEA